MISRSSILLPSLLLLSSHHECAAFVARHSAAMTTTTTTTQLWYLESSSQHTTTTTTPSVTGIVEDNNTMSADDVQQMLDEAMLLYASPSLHDGDDDDMQAYRKKEVRELVQELLLLQSGGTQAFDLEELDDDDDSDDDDLVITPTLLKAEPQQSLNDISHALDAAILGGYDPNFSEAEIEQWVQNIDSLSKQMEHQLKAIPSAESSINAITVTAETILPETKTAPVASPLLRLSTKEQFEARLEQLKVLIDPLGDSRTPTPLVGSQIVQEEEKVATPPTIAAVASTVEQNSTPQPDEIKENAAVESEAPEKSTVPAGAFFASVSDEATDDSTNDEISSSVDELAAMALSMEAGNATAQMDPDAADVVSAVVSVAALSAAAVTKLPIFVAGVAMAPLVKSSIAYYQGRMSSDAADAAVVADAAFANATQAGYGTLSEAQKLAFNAVEELETPSGSSASNSTGSGAIAKSLLEPDALLG